MNSIRPRASLLALLFFFLAAALVQAHPGHDHPHEEVDEFEQESFMMAVRHPFTGLDHLLAAVAIGGVAVAMGGRRGLTLVGTFLGTVAVGFAIGQSGWALPMIEEGLAAAVLAAGLLLLAHQRAGMVARFAFVALAGFWNGNAHGMESMHASFGVGLCVGTAALVLLGAATAKGLSMASPALPRFVGAGITLAGIVLCISRLG